MQAIFETGFDLIYLVGIFVIGINMIKSSEKGSQFYTFGIMAIVLVFGDSFHLIPRMVALNTSGLENFTFSLGLGKLITSITMTIFYVILYWVWKKRYEVSKTGFLDYLVYLLALVRISLCLLVGDDWFGLSNPLTYRLYRNIPFLLLGILIIYLYFIKAWKTKDCNFKYMYLTIILSFAFYIPVVLFEVTYPLVGVLMIPKTCAYIWTILIGYIAMKREANHEKIH